MEPKNIEAQRIMVQFSFSNASAVPSSIHWVDSETQAEASSRHDVTDGELLIEPTLNTYLIDLWSDLKAGGWLIANAYAQERIGNNGRKYAMVRFVFSKESTLGKEERKLLKAAMIDLCFAISWRVRAFVNGDRISVNLEVRTPLLRPDGSPVTQWQKDEAGKRIGDAPKELLPDFSLRYVEGQLGLYGFEPITETAE